MLKPVDDLPRWIVDALSIKEQEEYNEEFYKIRREYLRIITLANNICEQEIAVANKKFKQVDSNIDYTASLQIKALKEKYGVRSCSKVVRK